MGNLEARTPCVRRSLTHQGFLDYSLYKCIFETVSENPIKTLFVLNKTYNFPLINSFCSEEFLYTRLKILVFYIEYQFY